MINHYKEKLLSQSLAVRTPVLPEIEKIIQYVKIDLNSVTEYKTNIIDWLLPIVDLRGFYVYPTNGITEGLNWWMSVSKNNILLDNGDYQWVENINSRSDPPVFYQSIPSAIDGNFRSIKSDYDVALDLAYVGSTEIKKVEISNNVKYVFYSLSKPFGLRNIRTGWYFTREPDQKLESLIRSAKYYNYYANAVSEDIISHFDVDYIHKRISTKQRQICDLLDLTPSDSVWLATTENEDYKKFRRTNNLARVCLSGVYELC